MPDNGGNRRELVCPTSAETHFRCYFSKNAFSPRRFSLFVKFTTTLFLLGYSIFIIITVFFKKSNCFAYLFYPHCFSDCGFLVFDCRQENDSASKACLGKASICKSSASALRKKLSFLTSCWVKRLVVLDLRLLSFVRRIERVQFLFYLRIFRRLFYF